MPKKAEKETLLLINAGREMSEGLLESAVLSAKDSGQMSNQIFVLRRCAISILAHEGYNQFEQRGRNFNDYLNDLLTQVRAEFDMLCTCDDFEIIKTENSDQVQ